MNHKLNGQASAPVTRDTECANTVHDVKNWHCFLDDDCKSTQHADYCTRLHSSSQPNEDVIRQRQRLRHHMAALGHLSNSHPRKTPVLLPLISTAE